MRRILLVLTIAVLCLRPRASAQGFAFDLFQEYLEPLRVQAGIPGLAAAIVGSEGILWEHAYGQQDIAASLGIRTDTLFHIDGLTQVMTASLVLRCVEDRRLSLNDTVGEYAPAGPDADATLGQLLTHTSGSLQSPVFSYRPQRLEPLKAAIRACTEDSFRETLGNTFGQFAMVDSVPGEDVVDLKPPAEGIPTAADRERYSVVLRRLATPYAIDSRGRASVGQYVSKTLTPSGGMISTVRDLAKFDLALRQGRIVHADTLDGAWRAPSGRGEALPHGIGWFVQSYAGERVVWQFGVGQGASSSLMVTLPSKGITMILLANSDRLVRPLPLADGDISVSPFARLFFNLFLRLGAQ